MHCNEYQEIFKATIVYKCGDRLISLQALVSDHNRIPSNLHLCILGYLIVVNDLLILCKILFIFYNNNNGYYFYINDTRISRCFKSSIFVIHLFTPPFIAVLNVGKSRFSQMHDPPPYMKETVKPGRAKKQSYKIRKVIIQSRSFIASDCN